MNRLLLTTTVTIVSLLLGACAPAPSESASAEISTGSAATDAPTAASVPSVTPTLEPSPSSSGMTPSTPPLGALVDCDDGATGGDLDYFSDPSGGNPDLAAATRGLRGVRWSDVIAVEGNRSRVVREGRTVFVGSWFKSTSGGWLIYAYEACSSARVDVTQPVGLVQDAINEVVVDGGVRVRSLPTVAPSSIKYEPLLRRGDEVFIIDGPVPADGYAWYLVQSLLDGAHRGPFGWVASASREGDPWIDHRAEDRCPRLPEDVLRLGVIAEEVLLHCFGASELTFELEAVVYCVTSDSPAAIEPAWLSVECGVLSGDACGSCGIPIAADPLTGIELPEQDVARWAISGHFDDPASASCRATSFNPGDSPPELIVHRCRTTFVLTSLARLGEAA